jgi:hypothetical protein
VRSLFEWASDPLPALADFGGNLAEVAVSGQLIRVCSRTSAAKAQCAERAASGAWSVRTVASMSSLSIGLAQTDSGTPTVAFRDTSTSKLAVHRLVGNSWQKLAQDLEPAYLEGFPGNHVSMSTDAAGNTHLAYVAYNASFKRVLRYGTDASGSWVFEDAAVAEASNQERLPVVLAAADGTAHIVYRASDGTLALLRREVVGWQAAPAPAVGSFDEMDAAMDPTGAIHVITGSRFLGQKTITLWSQTGDGWASQLVPLAQDYSYSASGLVIACSAPGACQVLDRGGSPQYARQVGGVWHVGPIVLADSSASVTGRLALDASQGPVSAWSTSAGATHLLRLAPGAIAPAADPAGDGVDRNCDGVD